jgi:ElaB/YqjD/DUF883 family membrane-anchored ribosome-binding protein
MIDQDKIKDYAQSAQSAVENNQDKLKTSLYEAERRLKQSQEHLSRWAADLDKQAHERPWPVVASIGIGCLLLGVIIGRMRN